MDVGHLGSWNSCLQASLLYQMYTAIIGVPQNRVDRFSSGTHREQFTVTNVFLSVSEVTLRDIFHLFAGLYRAIQVFAAFWLGILQTLLGIAPFYSLAKDNVLEWTRSVTALRSIRFLLWSLCTCASAQGCWLWLFFPSPKQVWFFLFMIASWREMTSSI